MELVDDNIFEVDEELRLVLGTPSSESAGRATLGLQNFTTIRIKDIGDCKYRIFINDFVKQMFDLDLNTNSLSL